MAPHKPPNAPRRGEENTNESQIEVVFDQVLEDGGSSIITYSIEMSHDGGLFEEVSSAPLLTSPAVISNENTISGAYLTFRYRAFNVHGWSDYSDEFVIVAATVPEAPTNVATVSSFTSSKLTLRWVEP